MTTALIAFAVGVFAGFDLALVIAWLNLRRMNRGMAGRIKEYIDVDPAAGPMRKPW